ncbi:MAG: RidA family protein [Deltaproteobacteria bacterium]
MLKGGALLKGVVIVLAASIVSGCCAGPAKEVIATSRAPAAIGPYSQAVKSGNLLFLSGQIAIDPQTNQFLQGPIEEQTRQVLENLKAVLAANGMTLEHVVSTTVFLTDLNDFAQVNHVYGSFFKNKPPARATVQVSGLPWGARVEISAIASR